MNKINSLYALFLLATACGASSQNSKMLSPHSARRVIECRRQPYGDRYWLVRTYGQIVLGSALSQEECQRVLQASNEGVVLTRGVGEEYYPTRIGDTTRFGYPVSLEMGLDIVASSARGIVCAQSDDPNQFWITQISDAAVLGTTTLSDCLANFGR